MYSSNEFDHLNLSAPPFILATDLMSLNSTFRPFDKFASEELNITSKSSNLQGQPKRLSHSKKQ